MSSEQGNPLYVTIDGIHPMHMTEETISVMRGEILSELGRIAALPDNSPELLEFNRRLGSRITETRRYFNKFISSPPGFGFRGTGSGWMDHLRMLGKLEGFRKSLTLRPTLDKIEKLVSSGRNVWRERLSSWKILATTPYAVAARPSAELIEREERERRERLAAETARLRERFGAGDEQDALGRYLEEYDAATRDLDELAARVPTPRFVDDPPLTVDDRLEYQVTKVAGGIPMVASTFENMTGATVGLALRLDGVPETQLHYLSMLPTLLTQSGVIEKGMR